MPNCVFCEKTVGESSLCRRCADLCVMIHGNTATARRIVEFYEKPVQSDTEGATGTGYGGLAASEAGGGTFSR